MSERSNAYIGVLLRRKRAIVNQRWLMTVEYPHRCFWSRKGLAMDRACWQVQRQTHKRQHHPHSVTETHHIHWDCLTFETFWPQSQQVEKEEQEQNDQATSFFLALALQTASCDVETPTPDTHTRHTTHLPFFANPISHLLQKQTSIAAISKTTSFSSTTPPSHQAKTIANKSNNKYREKKAYKLTPCITTTTTTTKTETTKCQRVAVHSQLCLHSIIINNSNHRIMPQDYYREEATVPINYWPIHLCQRRHHQHHLHLPAQLRQFRQNSNELSNFRATCKNGPFSI